MGKGLHSLLVLPALKNFSAFCHQSQFSLRLPVHRTIRLESQIYYFVESLCRYGLWHPNQTCGFAIAVKASSSQSSMFLAVRARVS
jgi:hypothetical protein